MQKIFPHLWYDKEAAEAVTFYTGIFDDAKILNKTIIRDTPSGDAELLSFQLEGQQFAAISAGPFFQFNPSVSFMVFCDTPEEVDKKHAALSKGGVELMPLGEYTFSKRYAWIQDRFGLSWQLMGTAETPEKGKKIVPILLFGAGVCGKAEEAVNFYTELFHDSGISLISHYGEGEAQVPEASVNYAAFCLEGISFGAMDHGYGADFSFNEAVSFIINCQNQQEIDYYWKGLSFVPEAEQCGWLKDRYGVSWQVTPAELDEIMYHGSEDEKRRVTEAFLKMKKFDLEELKRARIG